MNFTDRGDRTVASLSQAVDRRRVGLCRRTHDLVAGPIARTLCAALQRGPL
jgi:hypothetical protein